MARKEGTELTGEGQQAASAAPVSAKRRSLLSHGERSRIIWTVLTAVLLVMAASLSSKAAELNAETVTAWDHYIQTQNVRVAASCSRHVISLE